MSQHAPKTVYLKDYRPPSHWIDQVRLHFELNEDAVRVANLMSIRINSAPDAEAIPLALNGNGQRLISVALDGRVLSSSEYQISDGYMTILAATPDAFELEVVSDTEPTKNLAFEGLYKSSGMFCTQCEAEGFRRISYFLDRPDVMSKYSVTITAEAAKYPTLLSNGNLVSKRALANGRHEAIWEDPFPKPCYLFAMVAGDLGRLDDSFVRKSGRPVALTVFCEKGLEERCLHAMDSLKKAMKWDEDVFGLEYDLDSFMIVVSNDFNMGAMENKGLNVFNASYVLAKPETATDADYDAIMAVVGHEYFHNWTGNRVTCRDWFQLSLKEGLTVFRDQEFSSDMGSRAVARIDDVIRLRSAQFSEDAGPMAHPIRPQSYIAVNNFYTATVYEKGAEIVRMIQTILGPTKFRAGMDKYFELFDGQAVTTEDFVRAMELASGESLALFSRWYDQSGTPVVRARGEHKNGTYRLTLSQSCPPTPGQPTKDPLHIPFAFGLLAPNGSEVALDAQGSRSLVLHLRTSEQSFEFKGAPADSIPSFLRGFSAPVKLEYDYSDRELEFIMARDSDAFARWEAAQTLASRELKRMISGASAPRAGAVDAFIAVLREAELSEGADPQFIALMLLTPSEQYLAQQCDVVNPDAIFAARTALRTAIARAGAAEFEASYRRLLREPNEPGRRALKNRALDYLCLLESGPGRELARVQLRCATNMTDELGALAALAKAPGASADEALQSFFIKWKSEPLVINKWLALQATSPALDAMERVKRIALNPVFDKTNPSKIYALYGQFAAGNPSRFHALDGSGYALIGDQILDVGARNPQVGARLASAFNQWRRYDGVRQALMRAQLSRVLAEPGLSNDIYEIASKALDKAP